MEDENVAENGAEGQESLQDDIGKVRREAKNLRERLRASEAELTVAGERAEVLARQLFTAKVSALAVLADPTDLPYDADLLDDDEALNAAVTDLVAQKPHLAKRKVTGDVGQGERGASAPTSFATLFN